MKRVPLLLAVVLILTGVAPGADELAREAENVRYLIEITDLEIPGRAEGGTIEVWHLRSVGNDDLLASVKTRVGDTREHVARAIAAQISAKGKHVLVSDAKISIVDPFFIEQYSVFSTDAGIRFPPPVSNLRAEFSKEAGGVVLHWDKSPDVAYVVVSVNGMLEYPVVEAVTMVDKRSWSEEGKSPRVRYRVVSMGKDGVIGGFARLTYPGKGVENPTNPSGDTSVPLTTGSDRNR